MVAELTALQVLCHSPFHSSPSGRHYLDNLQPLVRPGGLIIAHNMRYPSPDPDYIQAITKDPKLDTSFLLMEGAGVGVTLKKR